MNRYVKVAISLPEELLASVDRRRRALGTSRSGYFREALESHIERSSRSDIERYVEGYRLQPETDEEIEASMSAALPIVTAERWE